MATTQRSALGSHQLGTPNPGSPKHGSPDTSTSQPDTAEYSATEVLAMSDEEFGQYIVGPQKAAILGVFFGELSVRERDRLVQKLTYFRPGSRTSVLVSLP
jgi:hypothetical protein